MTKETLPIRIDDLKIFQDACTQTRGVDFLGYDGEYAEIEYNHHHCLYFLGRNFQIKKTFL